MSVKAILLQIMSVDQRAQAAGRQAMGALISADGEVAISDLLTELSNDVNSAHVRNLAGYYLKSILGSDGFPEQWFRMGELSKRQIKQTIVLSFGSHIAEIRRACAFLCSRLALSELRRSQWLDIIDDLTKTVSVGNIFHQESCTLCLTYIMEGLGAGERGVIKDHRNELLTMLVNNCRHPNLDIKRYSIVCLSHCAEDILPDPSSDAEVNYVVGVLKHCIDTTVTQDFEVIAAALKCLIITIRPYYTILGRFLHPVSNLIVSLFDVEDDNIHLTCIEFWNTICDIEIEYEVSSYVSNSFAVKYAGIVVPHLLLCCLRQDEGSSDADWNVTAASTTCLASFSRCIGNFMLSHVSQFITQHLNNSEWRYREAAITVLGAIAEGPDEAKLYPLCYNSAPVIIEYTTKERSIFVLNSCLWTLGRLCKFCRPAISPYTVALAGTLIHALQRGDGALIPKACWALTNFCDVMRGADEKIGSHFAALCGVLMKQMGKKGPHDVQVIELFGVIVRHLEDKDRVTYCSLICETMNADLDKLNLSDPSLKVLSAHCAAMQSIISAGGECLMPIMDKIVLCLLRWNGFAVNKEDVTLALGAVLDVTRERFEPYLANTVTAVLAIVKQTKESDTFCIAINFMGKCIQYFGVKMNKYSDEFMTLLFKALGNPDVSRIVKMEIVRCFGDSVGVGEAYTKYLPSVMSVLHNAGSIVPPENDELKEYQLSLMEAVVRTYSHILQGCKVKKDGLKPYLVQIYTILERIMKQPVSDTLLCASAELVGDIANVFGAKVREIKDTSFVQHLMRSQRSKTTSRSLDWCFTQLQQIP